MRLTLLSILLGAFMCLSSSCQTEPDGLNQAWFYSPASLNVSPAVPETWCSFVTVASAKAAASSERFQPEQSGWLRYRSVAIDSLVIVSQSEDAYLEDTYTFGPDLTVDEVVRKGHYVVDPFASATFRPDASGHLTMTAESRRTLRSWHYTTYFFEWPLYAELAEIPFAGLISRTPGITVSEGCQQLKS